MKKLAAIFFICFFTQTVYGTLILPVLQPKQVAEIATLEKKLVANPLDLTPRIRVLNLYSIEFEKYKTSWFTHIKWLIQNKPYLKNWPPTPLRDKKDDTMLDEASKLWSIASQKVPTVQTFINAAIFFEGIRPETSIEYFLKAKSKDLKHFNYSGQLVAEYLKLSRASDHPLENKYLKRAKEEFDSAQKPPSKNSIENYFWAKMAYDLGYIGKSKEYLNNVTHPPTLLNYRIQSLLGKIAFASKNGSEAEKHLLKSVENKSVVQMEEAPNLTLARDLANSGHKDAVLKFLDTCKTLWPSLGADFEDYKNKILQGQKVELKYMYANTD